MCTFARAEEPDNGWEVAPPPPEELTLVEEMQDIATRMVYLEDKLHEDRHDLTVQMDGKKIEDDLDKLIKEYEEKAQKEADGKGPRKKSELPTNRVPENITRNLEPDIAWTIRQFELGLDARSTQTWGSEMPERWRNRIAAYYLSINAEENKLIIPKSVPVTKLIYKSKAEQSPTNQK